MSSLLFNVLFASAHCLLIAQIEGFPGSYIRGREGTIDKTRERFFDAAYRPSLIAQSRRMACTRNPCEALSHG